jgi:hypothetical protein
MHPGALRYPGEGRHGAGPESGSLRCPRPLRTAAAAAVLRPPPATASLSRQASPRSVRAARAAHAASSAPATIPAAAANRKGPYAQGSPVLSREARLRWPDRAARASSPPAARVAPFGQKMAGALGPNGAQPRWSPPPSRPVRRSRRPDLRRASRLNTGEPWYSVASVRIMLRPSAPHAGGPGMVCRARLNPGEP